LTNNKPIMRKLL